MKVAVTGGNGHIGRAIVEELLSHGSQVVVGDRQLAADLPAPARLVDLEDLGQVVSLLDACDAVVHAAAIPRPGGCPDQVLFRTNMMTLFNALEACRLLGIKRFVWTSSMSVLGYPFNYRPIIPTYLPFDEQHPQDPQDPYALSKALGEQLVASYAARCGLTAISLRIVWAHTPATFQRDLMPFWRDPAGGPAISGAMSTRATAGARRGLRSIAAPMGITPARSAPPTRACPPLPAGWSPNTSPARQIHPAACRPMARYST